MCNACPPEVKTYGQHQPEARQKDKERLITVRRKRAARIERAANRHLN
jgi:hypothetical protein